MKCAYCTTPFKGGSVGYEICPVQFRVNGVAGEEMYKSTPIVPRMMYCSDCMSDVWGDVNSVTNYKYPEDA